jgi:hypothetical protein
MAIGFGITFWTVGARVMEEHQIFGIMNLQGGAWRMVWRMTLLGPDGSAGEYVL